MGYALSKATDGEGYRMKYYELLLSAQIANKVIAAYQTLENVGARVPYGNGSFDS